MVKCNVCAYSTGPGNQTVYSSLVIASTLLREFVNYDIPTITHVLLWVGNICLSFLLQCSIYMYQMSKRLIMLKVMI